MPVETRQETLSADDIHREELEEEATHVTDEARMVLPGVQAIMGFQLIAVFNQRFDSLSAGEQIVHLVAFFLIALTMGLLMAPAAYHRQAERGCVTRRFVNLASTMVSMALLPLILGVSFDAYILVRLVTGARDVAIACAVAVMLVLAGLWFALPQLARRRWRH
jgi:hypothetical protein